MRTAVEHVRGPCPSLRLRQLGITPTVTEGSSSGQPLTQENFPATVPLVTWKTAGVVHPIE